MTTGNIKTKNMVLTGILIALGIVLPLAFHAIPNAGSIFLPMHLPVLFCGLVCGWSYGLLAGIATPLLSSILTGMPPAPILPGMLVELAVYGLVAGLLIRFVKSRSQTATVFIALIGAMLAGRVLAGLVNALIFNLGTYSLQIWLSAFFITALPGIALQLVLIPALIFALRKAKLISLPTKQ